MKVRCIDPEGTKNLKWGEVYEVRRVQNHLVYLAGKNHPFAEENDK